MKATILTVGTEILFGSIVNTNAVFLSRQLNFWGIDVIRHITVGDNRGRLLSALSESFKDCSLVLVTGGLGPTEDDLTKETIAEFFGKKLVEDKEQMEILRSWFSSNNRTMSPNNIKQAYLPEGSEALPNPNGTAPGFMLKDGERIIFVMPGPPRENIPMFLDHVAPKLSSDDNGHLVYRMIRTIGIGESDLETALLDLIDGQTDPTIATYVKDFTAMVRVASKRRTEAEASAAIDDMTAKIRERIGRYIYSENDEDLEAVILRIMRQRGLKLSSAESMTGGLFAKMITDVPGASSVFDRSLVTYSNNAKMTELGVKKKTLEKYTAVSSETAAEMAEGLCRASGSDICISVTGYAGPGDSDAEPAGLFYVGACAFGKTTVREYRRKGARREDVRLYACRQMLRTIYELLK